MISSIGSSCVVNSSFCHAATFFIISNSVIIYAFISVNIFAGTRLFVLMINPDVQVTRLGNTKNEGLFRKIILEDLSRTRFTFQFQR